MVDMKRLRRSSVAWMTVERLDFLSAKTTGRQEIPGDSRHFMTRSQSGNWSRMVLDELVYRPPLCCSMTLPAWLFDRLTRDDGSAPRAPRAVADDSNDRSNPIDPDVSEIAALTALRGDDDASARRALEQLYRTYAPALANFANSFLRSPDDARDIVADVFTAVWAGRRSFEPSGRMAAYLYTAIRHRALNSLRDASRRLHRDRRLQTMIADGHSGSVSEVPMSAGSVIGQLEHEEAVRAVNDAIAKLSPERRRVMTLRWQHGLSNGEIAAVLELSEKTVRNQLSLSLAQLRVLLASVLSD
jgi:RNA polymerase sigma-70 factor (ECF subfamily)